MNIKVGGREHITSAALLVPENEDAWIEFVAGTWNIRINVVFVSDLNEKNKLFHLVGMTSMQH